MYTNQIILKRPKVVTAVLGLLTIFPPLSTDMYLAAIGEIAASLHTNQASAELSLSLFFLGLCIGQIIIGPLVDSFGRKIPLVIGVIIFIFTSIALVLVDDIVLFNTLRFVQAIGACAGMVVGRAIVNDLYSEREAAKVMSTLVIMLTIGPIISPSLGSILLTLFGWRSIFVVMVLVGLVACILTVKFIPETLPKSARKAASVSSVLIAFVQLSSKSGFIVPAFISGLVQGGLFAFITGSSGVFQGVFGLTALEYGATFAGIAFALVLFGWVNKILLNHLDSYILLKVGLPLYLVISFVLVMSSLMLSMWLFVIALWFAMGLIGLLSANSMSLAMSAVEEEAGIGSALLGSIQFIIAFAVSISVAMAGTDSLLSLALGLFIPCMLAIIIFSSQILKVNTSEVGRCGH